MPKGVVYVGRPSRWANPFVVGEMLPFNLYCQYRVHRCETAAQAVDLFRRHLFYTLQQSDASVDVLLELRGKDLACWCPLDQPCHADILLELANKEAP
jgi:hypothetical protein